MEQPFKKIWTNDEREQDKSDVGWKTKEELTCLKIRLASCRKTHEASKEY